MLTLILVDSELELVPARMANHPSIKRDARKRGKKPWEILLDSSLHYRTLKKLANGDRRGRPDIVHLFLLIANDSILNKEGMLRVFVHTRNDELISIDPEMRVIGNYDRFKGLMEQLFQKGVVPNKENALMSLRRGMGVKETLDEINPDKKIAFSSKGKETSIHDYFRMDSKKDMACIIGGFPKGGFISPINELVDDVISIHQEMLSAWTVASEVIVNYEYWIKSGEI